MEQARLTGQLREVKGSTNAIRRAGSIPAIVYGHKVAPAPIQLSERDLRRLLASGGENVIINMDLGKDEPETVIIKEVQIDPVTRRILHADFMRVSMEERIATRVSLVVTGTAAGVSAGGVMEFLLRELHIECQAANIPEHIELDVSSLGIGDQIRVENINPGEGITVLDDLMTTVVTITAPSIHEEKPAPEVAVQEEEIEPEVIGGRGKAEEEEEE